MTAKNWATSSGLRTTGSFLGVLVQTTPSLTHGRLEGGAEEEAEGGAGLVEAGPGGPLLDEVEQIGADVLVAEVLGRGVEVAGEGGDAVDVGLDGALGQVAEAHVLDHAAA